MEAIAHSPSFAKKAGVPVSVGKDFARADDKAGITKTHNGQPAKRTNGSSPRSREEHIAQRKSQGMTQKDVGAEFGRHRTTIGRVLRQGFNKGGSARD